MSSLHPDHQSTDDMYDDACDLGQFCLNPGWFLFVKMKEFYFWNFHESSSSSLEKKKKKSVPILSSIQIQHLTYLIAVYGSWFIIFSKGYTLFRESPHVSNIHMTVGNYLFCFCIGSYLLARSTSPGIITEETMSKFDNYQYDDVLYTRNQVCPTLTIRKLPRSKYDRYTHRHVARFDHFCGWINQSIGEENYRWFLLFLSVHTFMCIYGTFVTFIALWGEACSVDGGSLTKMSRFLSTDYSLTAVLLLMGNMALVLTAFLSFHLFIISEGMTTNEYYKWKIINERYAKGCSAAVSNGKNFPLLGGKAKNDEESNNLAIRSVGTSMCPPINQYNLGVFRNFYEVICPRSLFQHRGGVIVRTKKL
mmetsp:Transcript_28903/g.43648  ORF Transcript_28903/g.43648 Transcript_28903/m.43648 type:complete len:364 (-) Transcript_28903:51-1142(-)